MQVPLGGTGQPRTWRTVGTGLPSRVSDVQKKLRAAGKGHPTDTGTCIYGDVTVGQGQMDKGQARWEDPGDLNGRRCQNGAGQSGIWEVDRRTRNAIMDFCGEKIQEQKKNGRCTPQKGAGVPILLGAARVTLGRWARAISGLLKCVYHFPRENRGSASGAVRSGEIAINSVSGAVKIGQKEYQRERIRNPN